MDYENCIYFKVKDITLQLDKERTYYPVYDYYCYEGGWPVKPIYPVVTCNKCKSYKTE